MLQDVDKLLKPGVLGKIYPGLEGMTPDIAGFGWFQGWNDGTSFFGALLNITYTYSHSQIIHAIPS